MTIYAIVKLALIISYSITLTLILIRLLTQGTEKLLESKRDYYILLLIKTFQSIFYNIFPRTITVGIQERIAKSKCNKINVRPMSNKI